MKFRTLKYFIKEGISNMMANKWMSVASTCVVLLTLSLCCSFFLIAVNFDSMLGKVEDQPMEAFLVDSADQKLAESTKGSIEKIAGVKKVTLVTKEQGLEELKKELGKPELFTGIQPQFLSYKLVINVNSPADAPKVKTQIEANKNIKNVNFAKEVVEKVAKAAKIIRILAYGLFLVLGMVALFIIIYTIKLTVFSRRREINIMKYVGATDWFIKWPFVIEGVVIGAIGAIIGAILIFLVYGYVAHAFANIKIIAMQLIPLTSLMKKEIFIIFVLTGASIGAGGSIISVRKYLYV